MEGAAKVSKDPVYLYIEVNICPQDFKQGGTNELDEKKERFIFLPKELAHKLNSTIVRKCCL